MKTIDISTKSSLASKNSKSLLLHTNSMVFKYAQACGYFPLSVDYNSALVNHRFLTFPHRFLLNCTRLLFVGQSCWLLIFLLNQIKQFYSNSDSQFRIKNLGDIFGVLLEWDSLQRFGSEDFLAERKLYPYGPVKIYYTKSCLSTCP